MILKSLFTIYYFIIAFASSYRQVRLGKSVQYSLQNLLSLRNVEISSESFISSSSKDSIFIASKIQDRNFLPLVRSYTTMDTWTRYGMIERDFTVRILQFNILADGLSGSRDDLGNFSRTPPELLDWTYRKTKILEEITQYNPDIVTLQEVDHYHDFLLPLMLQKGYIGFFAPKPTSKCLECGGSADGCAMFIRSSRFRVLSAETKTLALSKAELTDSGELNEDERNILAQNQVALIVVCDLLSDDGNVVQRGADKVGPPIIITTTHLKSEKSPVGERYRERGIGQVLYSMEKIYNSYVVKGRVPAVILSGDFNAEATRNAYPPLAYEKVKKHPFLLRSVYNDDLVYSPTRLSSDELYTTWKARQRGDGPEIIVKRSIDYIFYSPFQPSTIRRNDFNLYSSSSLSSMTDNSILQNNEPVVVPWLLFSKDRIETLKKTMSSSKQVDDASVLRDVFPLNWYRFNSKSTSKVLARTPSQVVVSVLLRLSVYLFGVIFPLTSFMSPSIATSERWTIFMTSLLGMITFEATNEGSIFKPRLAAKLDSEMSEIPIVTKKKEKKRKQSNKIDTLLGRSKTTVEEFPDLVNRNIESAFGSLKTSENKLFTEIASFTQQLRALPQYGRPGFRAVALLDIFDEEEIGDNFLPSEQYPSDHIAIAADLELLW